MPAAPAAPPPEAQSGFDIKGVIEKLFVASNSQIGEKLHALVTAKQFDRRLERVGRP